MISGLSERQFLHLASGEGAANGVRSALASLGREEAVLHSVDGIAEGSIIDVDLGGASRVLWWGRVNGRPLSVDEARKLDERPMWERVRSHTGCIVVWHGPIHVDRLLRMRAAWHLRGDPRRLFEVALLSASESRPPFHGAVGLTSPRALASRWSSLQQVSGVAMLADRWAELRDQEADRIRRLQGDDIVEYPVTACDADLVATATASWSTSARVIGHTLAEQPLSYGFVAWRLRELLLSGVMEGRGDVDEWGVPVDLRAIRLTLGP
jgi:hypothetical protein